MSGTDLWQYVRRYWHLVLGVPIFCCLASILIAFAFFGNSLGSTYSASTILNLNSGVGTVSGLARYEASEVMEVTPGISASIVANNNDMTVSIAVSGNDADACVIAAEQIAQETLDSANGLSSLKVNASGEDMAAFAGMAQEVSLAENKGALRTALIKVGVISFLCGFCVVMAFIVFMHLRRKPVIDSQGIEEATGLPVLGVQESESGSGRLLANIRFASKNDCVRSICVVPVSIASGSNEVSSGIARTFEDEGIKTLLIQVGIEGSRDKAPEGESGAIVMDCAPLDLDIASAYRSQRSDATVIVAKKWADSMDKLDGAVRELRLANANLVGVVFIAAESA